MARESLQLDLRALLAFVACLAGPDAPIDHQTAELLEQLLATDQ